ncbi:MAG: hypothetical protein AAB362_01895 [Patescibacteria group bacterium]
MRNAILIFLALFFLGCTTNTMALKTDDAITLKTIDLSFEGAVETITLSEKNLIKTCTLPSAGEPYAKNFGDRITHKNKKISWRVSVLGKDKNDALVFVAVSTVINKKETVANFSLVWDKEKWQRDESAGHKVTNEFLAKFFTNEEFSKLLKCSFDEKKEQKSDLRQHVSTNNHKRSF